MSKKKTTTNIEVCLESLEGMLEYWTYIERGLLNEIQGVGDFETWKAAGFVELKHACILVLEQNEIDIQNRPSLLKNTTLNETGVFNQSVFI